VKALTNWFDAEKFIVPQGAYVLVWVKDIRDGHFTTACGWNGKFYKEHAGTKPMRDVTHWAQVFGPFSPKPPKARQI